MHALACCLPLEPASIHVFSTLLAPMNDVWEPLFQQLAKCVNVTPPPPTPIVLSEGPTAVTDRACAVFRRLATYRANGCAVGVIMGTAYSVKGLNIDWAGSWCGRCARADTRDKRSSDSCTCFSSLLGTRWCRRALPRSPSCSFHFWLLQVTIGMPLGRVFGCSLDVLCLALRIGFCGWLQAANENRSGRSLSLGVPAKLCAPLYADATARAALEAA
jgi:hypothetical protein